MYLHAILTLCAICVVQAEVVSFQSCPVSEKEAAVERNCTVQEVRIMPCPEAADNRPCNLKRGKTAVVEFDYIPGASIADDVESKAYWATGAVDLPWVGMDTNGCAHTTCPTEKGKKNTYTYNLNISKKFPARNFDVKWKLGKEDEMECCFITKIKLVK